MHKKKTNWCWAACGEMILGFEVPSFSKGSFSSRQQRIVNIAKKDETANKTGNTDDIIGVAQNIDSTKFKNASTSSVSDSDNDFSTITSSIISFGKPVMISAYNLKPPFNSDNLPSKGHSLVAYSANDSTNTIIMYDPWKSTSTTITTTQKALIDSGFVTKAYPSTTLYCGIYMTY